MRWNHIYRKACLMGFALVGIARLHAELSAVKYRLRLVYGSKWVKGHFAQLNHLHLLQKDLVIIRHALERNFFGVADSMESRAKRLRQLLSKTANKTLSYKTKSGRAFAKAALSKIASRHGLEGRILLRSELGAEPMGGLRGQLLQSLRPLIDDNFDHLDPKIVRKLRSKRISIVQELEYLSVRQELEFHASHLFAIPNAVLAVART